MGAGAIVTKSVPDDSVVAGIPAKVIGNTWEFAERKLKAMPADWNNGEFQENIRTYLEKIVQKPQKVK